MPVLHREEYDDDQLMTGGEYDGMGEETERLESALAAERLALLELQLEQDEQKKQPQTELSPVKKKLKRELEQEALARLERAAKTESDFQIVTDWWDKLDANRERRERYHEVSRSGDDVPLDYGAAEDGTLFPDTLNGVLAKQMRKGDFLDVIFNCPYEIQELVTEEYLSKILSKLSADHKEVLFLHAVRAYSSQKIGEIRGQSDRNIRKVRNTLFRKIYKKLLPALEKKLAQGQPMTKEERQFVEDMKKAALDDDKDGSYNDNIKFKVSVTIHSGGSE